MTWRQVRAAGSGYGAAECAEDIQARHLRAIAAVGGLSLNFFAFWVVFSGENNTGKAAETRVASEIIDDAAHKQGPAASDVPASAVAADGLVTP